MDDGIRKVYLKGAPKHEAKVVKAFVASNAENALKTKPKVSCILICPLRGVARGRHALSSLPQDHLLWPGP